MALRGNNNRRLTTPQSVDQVVKSICDIMRRGAEVFLGPP